MTLMHFFFFSFCEFLAVSYPKLEVFFLSHAQPLQLVPLGPRGCQSSEHRQETFPWHKQCHIWVNDADVPQFENSDTQLSPEPLKSDFEWKSQGNFPFLPLSFLCPTHAEGDESSPQAAFLSLLNGPMSQGSFCRPDGTALTNALSKRELGGDSSQRELWIYFQSTNKAGKAEIISSSLLHLSAQQISQLTKGHCSQQLFHGSISALSHFG